MSAELHSPSRADSITPASISTARPVATPALEPALAPTRLLSLDAYRGFVIAAMTFVNYLAGLPRMPLWLLHADERPDTYTLPDLVFPGFLFIVGVALPLSLRATLEGRVPLR